MSTNKLYSRQSQTKDLITILSPCSPEGGACAGVRGQPSVRQGGGREDARGAGDAERAGRGPRAVHRPVQVILQLELPTNHRRSFHNHGEGPYTSK